MNKIFKQLIGENKIADEDAEGFEDFEMYADFTERLGEISSSEVEVEVFESEPGEISVLFNEKPIKLKYDDESGWFDSNFIGQINKHLKDNNITNYRFCFVEPYGLMADQGVKIAFIDEETYKNLLEKDFAEEELSKYNHF